MSSKLLIFCFYFVYLTFCLCGGDEQLKILGLTPNTKPDIPKIITWVQNAGYPIEEHKVVTPDGYILTMHRIPFGKMNLISKKVIFIQHGILCSSADWIVSGPDKGLAYILADNGYDVWLGNARGNTHSKDHIVLKPNQQVFWNFSWHEIGTYDLPTMIDYVLITTGETALHYIGHSQGTTSFFVMLAMHPDYNKKIRSMHALAPVAFMPNVKNSFIKVIVPLTDQVQWALNLLGVHEFFPTNILLKQSSYILCRDRSMFQEICANVLFLIAGYDSKELNRTIIPLITEITPAGAAMGQFVHYSQLITSGRFCMFDYGEKANRVLYGSSTPPNYDLNKIIVPITLYYGNNDWLTAAVDVEKLASQLPNLNGVFKVPDPEWNHLDFLYANNANAIVYQKIIQYLNIFDSNN